MSTLVMRIGLALPIFCLIVAPVNGQEEKEDTSTRVTGAVVLPKELASFEGQTLEIRLYKYDPFLADASADLVDKVVTADYSHTMGKETRTPFEIGAEGTIENRRRYYITVFVLKDGNRTHMGEKDGKRGLTKVLTEGNPREVTMIARHVGR